ncbi:hypothetical protein LTR70_006407 [Exophiala xenobiotica]|nr:hypothetical protein LTR70_006407 [Exophiala xenobiotica]
MDFQLGFTTIATESLQNYATDAAIGGDITMNSFVNLMDNSIAPNHDQWLVPNEQGSVTERSISPADEEILRAYGKMADFCEHIESWRLYDSKTPLHYIVTRVKGFTIDVATRNATPFLHRYLYRDHTPQCILSCFTASVLYANRTQANTAIVMRALHRNVRELVSAEISRAVATPVEKLARTQALFLYQVIRLLDGDIILRAQGERDIPLLQTWLGDLCKVRENLGDLTQLGASVVRRRPPGEWDRWIFAESVRRTILIAYSFITLYEAMKDPEKDGLIPLPYVLPQANRLADDQGPWAYAHRWTLSRHLWEADSSFEFASTWKEKPHFVITNYSFEHFLECGRGEDVDEFAQLLLSVYMGVDETSEFIFAKNVNR